jgi:hypothetical protein
MHPAHLATFAAALLAVPALAAQDSAKAAAQPPVARSGKAEKPVKTDISKLKFISGCWRAQVDKDVVVEENWSSPSENLYLATTRYLKKEHATGFEFTRIEVTDTGVVFSASSDGKPFDTYLMKTLVDEYVMFENPKKSFPQKIIYRMASDGVLIPRNEGEGPSVEIRMQRVKCPGADIKLKPDG